jgi:hypothetical protein
MALAGVMVGGPVFAAHVENEGIADAGEEIRHAIHTLGHSGERALDRLLPYPAFSWPHPNF